MSEQRQCGAVLRHEGGWSACLRGQHDDDSHGNPPHWKFSASDKRCDWKCTTDGCGQLTGWPRQRCQSCLVVIARFAAPLGLPATVTVEECERAITNFRRSVDVLTDLNHEKATRLATLERVREAAGALVAIIMRCGGGDEGMRGLWFRFVPGADRDEVEIFDDLAVALDAAVKGGGQ